MLFGSPFAIRCKTVSSGKCSCGSDGKKHVSSDHDLHMNRMMKMMVFLRYIYVNLLFIMYGLLLLILNDI